MIRRSKPDERIANIIFSASGVRPGVGDRGGRGSWDIADLIGDVLPKGQVRSTKCCAEELNMHGGRMLV